MFATFAIFALILFTQRHPLTCKLVGLGSYVEIAPEIFLSPKLPIEKHATIKSLIVKGKNRVNNTFGDMVSTPTIVIVANDEEAAYFGANSTATTHLTPLGACLILGPQGHNIDVIAHELVHAEVLHRVGWLTHLFNIPIWFNEGVALIVDHREPFLIKNIKSTPEEIKTVKDKYYGFDFFDEQNTHKNYLAARLAVNGLEPSSLYEKLSQIHDGKSFEEVFEYE